jgi:hypothetical protein
MQRKTRLADRLFQLFADAKMHRINACIARTAALRACQTMLTYWVLRACIRCLFPQNLAYIVWFGLNAAGHEEVQVKVYVYPGHAHTGGGDTSVKADGTSSSRPPPRSNSSRGCRVSSTTHPSSRSVTSLSASGGGVSEAWAVKVLRADLKTVAVALWWGAMDVCWG